MIEVYADGACRNNQQKENLGGWAYALHFLDYGKKLKAGAFERNTTNNKMELLSCINALKHLDKSNYNSDVIYLYSDSQYVVKGINEWSVNWIKNNWKNAKKKPVENKELWIELLDLKKKFNNITFEHVDGHSDCEGNNEVDQFVNYVMDKAEEN